MEMLDNGTIHVLGRTKQDGTRFHRATQNDTQLKIYELFISRIFHLIFLDRGQPQVTEATESKPQIRRDRACSGGMAVEGDNPT